MRYKLTLLNVSGHIFKLTSSPKPPTAPRSFFLELAIPASCTHSSPHLTPTQLVSMLAALAFLPLLASAAVLPSTPLYERQEPTADNAAGSINFGGFLPGSTLQFPGRVIATFVGNDNSTGASLFHFGDDNKVWSLRADRGDVVKAKSTGWRGWFQTFQPLGVDSNGLCTGCTVPSGDVKRQTTTTPPATNATPQPGIIGSLVQLVGGLVGAVVSIVVGAVQLVVQLVQGILTGFPSTASVSAGTTPMSVGNNGFLNLPNVSSLGTNNGIGGVFAGTLDGSQLWQYPDGKVYPMNLARDTAVDGATVSKNAAGRPICNPNCVDPYPNV